MLAIARALMSKPTMLLLDEPFLGLAPRIVEEIIGTLKRLQQDGLTILLVEQKLDIALTCTSRAYVMIKGAMALESTTQELSRREDLHDLYFKLSARQPDPVP
jgi:branched-chain amino acid transport system ATP-binding protein